LQHGGGGGLQQGGGGGLQHGGLEGPPASAGVEAAKPRPRPRPAARIAEIRFRRTDIG
jgi:hypothetical protein